MALFPNCVTESKDADGKIIRAVDFDQLRQELSDHIVEGPQERYQLNWPGKREALLAANAPIAKTLRPVRDESVSFDSTQNLFIEGDNLDALKLLQETYLGKVKMIYIDPPYNTGSDFIYEDDFAENVADYFQKSNQIDDHGNRMVANQEANGRFHSDWLSMIFSRLKLARNLLTDDGAIFISIDEVEVSNLRKLCDTIFGEDNFVECITWNKRIPKNDKGIGNIHEFILLYVKNHTLKPVFTMRKDGLDEIYDLVEQLKKKNTPLDLAEREIKKLYDKNGYDRGITLYNSLDENYKLWGKINMSWPNGTTFGPNYEVLHPTKHVPVKIPNRGWRWKKDTFNLAANINDGKYQSIKTLHDGTFMCGRIWFAENENMQPSSITYLDDVNEFLLRSIISLKSDGGIEVENLFDGKSLFPYPKPTTLLKILFNSLPSNDGDIYLDFFAGSATSAQSILELNQEDGVKRKFILVQIPEELIEESEAKKAGFNTIADISKERIRRVSKNISTEMSITGKINLNLDVGFRVLKIDLSNMADIYYSPDITSQANLFDLAENIRPERTSEDLLFQVLLDWGVDLMLPIAKETVKGQEVFFVDGNALAACFVRNGEINEDFCKDLAKRQPLRVVFRDAGFKSDDVKINVEQIFKLMSPHTEVKTI